MLINKRLSVAYFLNLIKWDVFAILLYTSIVGTLDHFFTYFKEISIPLGASAMVGTLLSLLLAFRTSQSYERWWEARIVWGAIVNDSRTFIRQLIQFIPEDEEKKNYLRAFAVRQSMWCYALSDNLRRLPYAGHVRKYMENLQLKEEHLPNQLLTMHAVELAALGEHYQLNANKQVQLDATLSRLTDSMGKCERIKNTVFPRSYSVLIHSFIYVLMTILPFGLDHNHTSVEVVLATLIPVMLIAIERTAILMQDPFENKPTDTPMTTLSTNIERNLSDMAGIERPVREVPEESYYVM